MTAHAKSLPWQVVRQYGHAADSVVCSHRWGWVADLCAARRTSSRSHRAEVGVHYAARQRPSVQYFCSTCAVSQGEEHLDWCHRDGVMAHVDPSGVIVSPPDTEAEVAARLRDRPAEQAEPQPCPNCLPGYDCERGFYATGEEMQPPPCHDHATNDLNCPVCGAQRRAFYAALGRDA